MWGLNAYSEIARFYREKELFARVIGGHPYINDFVLYYMSGQLAARGPETNIYDPEIQDAAVKAAIAPVVPELNFYMQYPPHFFALMKPFAYVSLGHAYLCWLALWIPTIALTLWQLFKTTLKTKMSRALAFAGMMASYPCWLMVELGQTALFQLPTTIAFWLLLRSERFFLAGLVSAILMIKLQYVPVFLLVGFLLGRWRYAAGLALSGAAVAVASYFTVGTKNIINYPQALVFGETSDKVSGVSAYMMQNVRGELVMLTGGESRIVHLAVLAIFAASILCIAVIWWRIYPKLSKSIERFRAFDFCTGVTVLLMLLASPHTHIQDFVLAVIALVTFYSSLNLDTTHGGTNSGGNDSGGNDSGGTTRILKFLIIAAPILSWFFFLGQIVFLLAHIQPYFAWALCVLGLAVHEMRKRLAAAPI